MLSVYTMALGQVPKLLRGAGQRRQNQTPGLEAVTDESRQQDNQDSDEEPDHGAV
jgi:hypothetical protein